MIQSPEQPDVLRKRRRNKILSRTAAFCLPLLFGVTLGLYHENNPQGKGSDFAYDNRIMLWKWVSHWSRQGAPFLSGRLEANGPFRPVEEVYTDDMGFSVLVDWATRLTGRELGRDDFFKMILGLNVALLWMFLGAYGRSPWAMLLASLLILFPSFYIPREIIGPDLFTLYGSLALACVAVTLGVFQEWKPMAWFWAGTLFGAVYFLRQAVGLIMALSLLLGFIFTLAARPRESLRRTSLGLSFGLGAFLCWSGFHGLLLWRDYQIGTLAEKRAARHHTVFHPLYVGIGNMEGNPWGIRYRDQFAYDQILGPGQKNFVYSEDYLKAVRHRYLSLWKHDGWRLTQWYARHFIGIVKTTMGYGTWITTTGYVLFILWRHRNHHEPFTIYEATVLSSATVAIGFLLQSTFVDGHPRFSYPLGLLGRYGLAFCAADAAHRCRLWKSLSHAPQN